ncbi:hypothetical protein ACFSCV_15755 [Methylopila henanensis]|uniref:GNAT family N-acetyltransferase n=1 Tax=Methylopila henanensis TaxID=873516 RepID=A0ABW4KAQ1_9HYPH
MAVSPQDVRRAYRVDETPGDLAALMLAVFDRLDAEDREASDE